MEKLITKSFQRLLDKGIHRGFITHDELSNALGKRSASEENFEKAFLYIFDNKVTLVEKKSDYRVTRKKESTSSTEEKSSDASEDPIRMYLKEMGGVELLSREGEISIAKRIEAGKDIMVNALTQSPITAKKIFEWKEQLEQNQLLIREIIDIDATYIELDGETSSKSSNKKANDTKLKGKNTNETSGRGDDDKEEKNNEFSEEEDEFNVSLAAMEEEIKPKIILLISVLSKNYIKLIKYQKEKLNAILLGENFTPAKEKGYNKIINILVEKFKSLQLSATTVDELVKKHYQENKKILSLEGVLLRSALGKAFNSTLIGNLPWSSGNKSDGFAS